MVNRFITEYQRWNRMMLDVGGLKKLGKKSNNNINNTASISSQWHVMSEVLLVQIVNCHKILLPATNVIQRWKKRKPENCQCQRGLQTTTDDHPSPPTFALPERCGRVTAVWPRSPWTETEQRRKRIPEQICHITEQICRIVTSMQVGINNVTWVCLWGQRSRNFVLHFQSFLGVKPNVWCRVHKTAISCLSIGVGLIMPLGIVHP